MRRRSWLVGAGLLLLISVPGRAADWIYNVRPGDNLWNIAETYLKGVRYVGKVQALNKIADPYRIPPGTPIRVPLAWLKYRPIPAKVIDVEGEARVQRVGGGSPLLAKRGLTLNTGDSLATASGASVTVEFADGSRLLLQEEGELIFDTISIYENTGMVDSRIRLRKGYADTRVSPKKGAGSRFEISTPAAVAAVRGTDFRINASADEAEMRAEVLDGRVGVDSHRHGRRLVGPGFGVVALRGRPLPPLKPLLPAPDLSTLPATVTSLPYTFEWGATPGATRYRAQIAQNRAFERLLLDQRVWDSKAELKTLPDGDYVLRVRAIDREGLEGLDAYHVWTLNARPFPPTALEPLDGGSVYRSEVTFAWSIPKDVASFHFQLSKSAEFRELLVNAPELEESRITPELVLQPGSYFWRLATTDSRGDRGPFGDTQRFDVKVPPAAPEGAEGQLEENRINFAWKLGGDDIVRYQFQLAEDEAFQERVIDRTVDENRLLVEKSELQGGTYFFRIRAQNRDDVFGAYSDPERIELPSDKSAYWLLMLPLVLIPILL